MINHPRWLKIFMTNGFGNKLLEDVSSIGPSNTEQLEQLIPYMVDGMEKERCLGLIHFEKTGSIDLLPVDVTLGIWFHLNLKIEIAPYPTPTSLEEYFNLVSNHQKYVRLCVDDISKPLAVTKTLSGYMACVSKRYTLYCMYYGYGTPATEEEAYKIIIQSEIDKIVKTDTQSKLIEHIHNGDGVDSAFWYWSYVESMWRLADIVHT
jgi:hypothetical protein